MTNYFRITAYHPETDTCAILDCNGKFDKCWEFSSMLVCKGFKIYAVGNTEKFEFGNIPAVAQDDKHIVLRACTKGRPICNGNEINVNDKKYTIV